MDRCCVALATLVLSCFTSSAWGGDAEVVVNAPLRRALDFNIIRVQGFYAPGVPTFLVIRDAAAWARFQREKMLKGPAIDFTKFALVVAATEGKSTLGYSVVVSSVDDVPKDNSDNAPQVIQVSILDLGPGSCGSLQALARPVAVYALIPASREPVRFYLRKAGLNCTASPQFSYIEEPTKKTRSP